MHEIPSVSFEHLDRMSDDTGLFEHAEHTEPRREGGYCTDDNARMLIATSRESDEAPLVRRLNRMALRFVLDAQQLDGSIRNRMDVGRRWTDRASTEDCWGRSVWALGVTATSHVEPTIRRIARNGFDKAVNQRSPWPRSMAFAALGAADVVAADPDHAGARSLLVDAVETIGTNVSDAWPWPEERLAYANATLAEAVIAAGAALESAVDVERGLAMLSWLLDLETRDGHLSPAPVGGRGPDDVGPRFDQQPIEAAAMADACARASAVSPDATWIRGIDLATQWFCGHNDAGMCMYDASSGGAYDGLQESGVNANQGAESTLALISTLQRSRQYAATV